MKIFRRARTNSTLPLNTVTYLATISESKYQLHFPVQCSGTNGEYVLYDNSNNITCLIVNTANYLFPFIIIGF